MEARATAPPASGHLSLVVPARQTVSQYPNRSQFLIATDDDDLQQTVEGAVRLLRGTAAVVRSGGAVMASVRASGASLVVLDQALPDVAGLDVARALCRRAPDLRFVLIGSGLSTSLTVEAMKLGAVTVLEKPVALNHLVEIIRCAATDARAAAPAITHTSALLQGPRSICERWAFHVLKACDADRDLRTIGAWASFAGLSYTSLCEICRLVGIRPRDARDFTRLLRAVAQSPAHQCRVEELLDISDRRTLNTLMARAGIVREGPAGRTSIGQYLASQRFVPPNHAGVVALRAMLVM